MKQEELVDYFDRELAYLRRAGAEFARKYPKIARRLELQANETPDPHVERLIEAFAFLTARIQRKIDDDFSEFSQALLGMLYPHYLAPVPSLCIAQFNADSAGNRASEGLRVPRHTVVYSAPVSGTRCHFRTCYEVAGWPIQVAAARVTSPRPELSPPPRARSVLTLRLQTLPRLKFSELQLEQLRFFIHDGERPAYALLEFLMNQVSRVDFVVDEGEPRVLRSAAPADCLKHVGFEPEDGVLAYDDRALLGHRLLFEYFIFPQKFLFVDLGGLEQVVPAVRGSVLDVLFYSDAPFPAEAEGIDASTFRLGCTPIVNLFRRNAEPIQVHHTRFEYPVVPDRFRQNVMEVYAIESVRGLTASNRAQGGSTEYRPFYTTAHGEHGGSAEAYWYASRRASNRDGDNGTDVFLSFVDLDFDPATPAAESVLLEILCTNRDLPAKLPFGESPGRSDFGVEAMAGLEVRCLTRPTPARRLKLGRGLQWRMISHLAVQLQSLIDPEHGREVLRELLSLYDFQDAAATRQQISGIHAISGRPIAARVHGEDGEVGMARGVEVTIEFDPECYVGSSVFLLASVLERFLGLQVSMNSFVKLCARLKGQKGYLKQWPPRAGTRALL